MSTGLRSHIRLAHPARTSGSHPRATAHRHDGPFLSAASPCVAVGRGRAEIMGHRRQPAAVAAGDVTGVGVLDEVGQVGRPGGVGALGPSGSRSRRESV